MLSPTSAVVVMMDNVGAKLLRKADETNTLRKLVCKVPTEALARGLFSVTISCFHKSHCSRICCIMPRVLLGVGVTAGVHYASFAIESRALWFVMCNQQLNKTSLLRGGGGTHGLSCELDFPDIST